MIISAITGIVFVSCCDFQLKFLSILEIKTFSSSKANLKWVKFQLSLVDIPFVRCNFWSQQKMAYKNMHNVYLHCHPKTFLVGILRDCPNGSGHDEDNTRGIHKETLWKGNIFYLQFEHFHREWAAGQKSGLMGTFSKILWYKHRGTKNNIIFEESTFSSIFLCIDGFGKSTISTHQLFR